MISHSVYEGDNRVMRYAETLVQRGDSVEIFALRRRPDIPKEEVISGVNVYRIQDRFSKGSRTKAEYLAALLRFLLVSSWEVTWRHWRSRYDVVHVHNIPDFLVFAALYPKLTGSKIILDVHDIVPELFAEMFNEPPYSVWVRTLKWMERFSARFANHVIISNHLWLEKYTSRAVSRDKCSVFINHVDTKIFRPRYHKTVNEQPVIVFPGGLQWHQGVDIAIRAFQQLRNRIPGAKFDIYGDGPMKQRLIALANTLGLNGSVRFFEPRELKEIAEVIARADLGVVPKRADSFGNEAYSTKILEFMAAGVPVVASSTKIDRYYFDDSMVRFFPPGDAESMAEAMYDVLTNRDLQLQMMSRGAEYAIRNNWGSRKAEYLHLIDSLRAA